MITGEERLRENLAELYGSVNDYEGRPSQAQVEPDDGDRARARRRVHQLRPLDRDRASEAQCIAGGPRTPEDRAGACDTVVVQGGIGVLHLRRQPFTAAGKTIMDRIARDFRTAVRGLRRTPTFSVTAVLILALGIGMAVAMFTVFDAVLVRQLPVQQPDRLVVLWTYQDPAVELSIGRKTFEQIRPGTRTLREVAGVVHWGATPAPLVDGERSVVLRPGAGHGEFL